MATDNAPNADGKETILECKPNIGEDIKNQIISELKKSFTNIASKSATPSPQFDIIITTGK